MFKLEIKTGGSAFCEPYSGEEDDWCEAREIARILDRVRDDLMDGLDHGIVLDLNGNKVGSWSR